MQDSLILLFFIFIGYLECQNVTDRTSSSSLSLSLSNSSSTNSSFDNPPDTSTTFQPATLRPATSSPDNVITSTVSSTTTAGSTIVAPANVELPAYHPVEPYPIHPWQPGYTLVTNLPRTKYRPLNNDTYAYYPYRSYPITYFHTSSNTSPPIHYSLYKYTTGDTGNSSLGSYLAHSLNRMNTPTFYFYGPHLNKLKPEYDHYSVHHYYHNRESIRPMANVYHDSIVKCTGDSSIVCPPYTYALCTSDGSIMCMVDLSKTKTCNDSSQWMCVSSQIPCIEQSTTDCMDKPEGWSTMVDLPCVYITHITGQISYGDNTVDVELLPLIVTLWSEVSTTKRPEISDTESVTESFSSYGGNTYSVNNPPINSLVGDHNFCVAVVVHPASRAPTEVESIFGEGLSLFDKFVASGLDT